jgi:hypothetical protein
MTLYDHAVTVIRSESDSLQKASIHDIVLLQKYGSYCSLYEQTIRLAL